MAAALKGKTKSPEHLAKISAALKGKKFTPEHRAALSAAKRKMFAERKNLASGQVS